MTSLMCEKQQLRSFFSSLTPAIQFGEEEKTNDDMLSPIENQELSVFWKQMCKERTDHRADSDIEEHSRRNEILRWLILKRMERTNTRQNEDATGELEEEHILKKAYGRRDKMWENNYPMRNHRTTERRSMDCA